MSRLLLDVRAFGAAARKEFRQIRRYPFLTVGMIFWPVMLPSMYVLMGTVYSGGGDPRAMAAFAARSGVDEVAGFVFIGFAMYMWLSILLWGPGTALRQEQLRGSLEAVFLTPASRLAILFGPPFAHVYTIGLGFVVMGVAMWLLFGVVPGALAVARAMVVIAVAIPAMFAIGSLFATAVLRWGEIQPSVHFVRGMLVLASGVTFPIVMLPDWARVAAAALPPTYIVSDLRRVLLAGAGLGGIAVDLAIVVGLTVGITTLAILVYGWVERSARRTGMLGRY